MIQLKAVLTEGERIGLIGVNGTGKSTLLQIISGSESGDKGTVTKAKDYTIGYLAQDPAFNEEDTVLAAVFDGGYCGASGNAQVRRSVTRDVT